VRSLSRGRPTGRRAAAALDPASRRSSGHRHTPRTGRWLRRRRYEVIAPSLYDRLEPGVRRRIHPEAIAKGVEYSQENPLGPGGRAKSKTASMCWPRRGQYSLPDFAGAGRPTLGRRPARCTGSQRLGRLMAGGSARCCDEVPQCQIIMHFGKTDASIPMENDSTHRRPDTGHSPLWAL